MTASWRLYFFTCFIGSFLSCTFNAAAQLPGMRKYTQLDGFTATNGYEFAQDARGLMWIGTDNGGMSFDGKKFKVLLGKGSFPDAEVLAVTPIDSDRVLLNFIIGDICYLEKGILVTARQDPRLGRMNNLMLNHRKQDPVTGALWLLDGGRFNTMYCFRGKDIKRYEFKKDALRIATIINNRFIVDLPNPSTGTHNLFVCDTTGVCYSLYDEYGQKISPEKSVTYAGSDPEYLIVFINNSRTIEAYRYRDGDSIIRRVKRMELPLSTKMAPKVYLDPNRGLWFKYAGQENIWYYADVRDSQQQQVFHFTEPGLLNTAFVDRNSNLWLSSKNNALYFLSRKHFRNVLLSQHFPMKKNAPRFISGDGKGTLYISYTNSSDLAIVSGNRHRIIRLGQGFEDGCNNILPIAANRFIAQGFRVALIDGDRYTVVPSIYINGKDICLYGTNGLLFAEGERTALITSFLEKKIKEKPIFSGRSTAIGVLQNGVILIGTPTGLYLKQSLDHNAVKISDTLIDRCNITDIQPLPDGGALIGTNALGLLHYNTSGRIREIQKEKLNHVRSIYRQNDSTYWTSTNEGVYAFTFGPDWAVSEVSHYTFYDGLPSNSATSVYVYQDTAYVATSDGLGILPLKDSTLLQMAPPDVYLNTLQTDKASFRYPVNPIALSGKQNNLLFSLSAISYESLGNIQYYYRLYPLQTQWVRTTDPDIRFVQLPPGRYIFQAYALNAKGVRSLKTVALNIYLQPAFWETLYFKIAILALIVLLFYFSLRWWLLRREKGKYKKIQDKKRLAELELEAIKAQINPHFIYNCLNSIQYLSYKAEHEQAQQYLDLFSRLIRMTMQYSQQTFLTLSEEVDYLSLYLQLEKLRFKDKMSYTIQIASGVDKGSRVPAMLIQPYVENAVKHGIAGKEKGEISIRFEEENGRLQITIRDNGLGFPELKKRPGALGLRISGTRAASYNELFNLNINIHCYNQQDIDPRTTGAVVHLGMTSLSGST